MDVLVSVEEIKRRLRPIQRQGLRVGLVPTMGALHAGHLSLVAEAKRTADVICASVFVNPTQFGANEDLERYPRDLERDRKQLEDAGCDVLFAPTVDEIYPDGFQTFVEVKEVSEGLCGVSRPTHFRGVATVVMKLFSIARPDVAVFGQKDYQQLAVIRRMARDLALDVDIVGAPIVREDDGLALSSRNVYLSPESRAQALSLYRGLRAAQDAHARGAEDAAALIAAARAVFAAADVDPEYLELRDASTLEPKTDLDSDVVLLVAAHFGTTRLIDNIVLKHEDRGAAR